MNQISKGSKDDSLEIAQENKRQNIEIKDRFEQIPDCSRFLCLGKA